MGSRGHWLGVFAILASGGLLGGCLAQPGPQGALPVSRNTPFVLDVPDTANANTARSQRPDLPAPPPSLPAVPAPPNGMPPPPNQTNNPPPAIQTVSLSTPKKAPTTVRVCAWVNGKPLFEDEVINILAPQLRRILTETPPAQRDAEFQRAFSKTLDALIDDELLQQDALKMLEKNPKLLEKLKEIASKQCTKQIKARMQAMKIATMDEFKQVMLAQGTTVESIRRMLEREVVAGEFLRSRIKHGIDEEVTHEVIQEYYNQHLNEFLQLDRVKWQDIFIAVGPKHPTMADARLFADQVLQCWAAGEDIAKLLDYDDGDSRYRKGDGAGEIKGDIKPRELEPYVFALKAGEFGQPLELSTGIHVYRVIKRDYAGVMPFDGKTQVTIKDKLTNEMAELERKHVVRELRERALIEIERQ